MRTNLLLAFFLVIALLSGFLISQYPPTILIWATLADGVILVYMAGKIGRGVLRRVKSNLENVDAKLTGVILNKVKSDAGPEYYQYHSYYYYGSEPQLKKGKKVKKVKKSKKNKISEKKIRLSNQKRRVVG